MEKISAAFLTGFTAGMWFMVIGNAIEKSHNEIKIETSQFESKCKLDNGVLINADKLYCIKQGVVLEVGR